ncbi:MAG: acetate--CoA ligase family protein [Desulfobacula sp.]|nr:acetate--CoA ligase family protein [Desulfobacula sp.]
MPDKIDKFVLEPEAVKQVEAYGIPYPEHSVAKSANEAAVMADKIGYPVVMKIVSPDVLHKSDVGGVIVGVDSAKAIREGYKTIVANVKNILSNSVINDVLICSQAKAGVEVIVGGYDY